MEGWWLSSRAVVQQCLVASKVLPSFFLGKDGLFILPGFSNRSFILLLLLEHMEEFSLVSLKSNVIVHKTVTL